MKRCRHEWGRWMPDTGYATYKASVCLKQCGRVRMISGYSGKITYSTREKS